MGGGENCSSSSSNVVDLYQVLGLKKECTGLDLRDAYKKLAMRWHPDRCSPNHVEEANHNFQAIQHAYSVLSDVDKRFLYDVGVYDDDDDDQHGMADFLSEMAVMMSQNESHGNGEESFEELKALFDEMFESDIKSFGPSFQTDSCSSYPSSLFTSSDESSETSNKQNSVEREDGEGFSRFDANIEGFCFGTGGTSGKSKERRDCRRRATASKKGRK